MNNRFRMYRRNIFLLPALFVGLIILHSADSSKIPSTIPPKFLLSLAMASSNKTDLKSIRVAILGGGNVGSILAQSLHHSGKVGQVKIAARDPERTKSQLSEKKFDSHIISSVESISDVLKQSDVIILATPSLHHEDGIKEIATSLRDFITDGKTIIIDATNPLSSFADGLSIRWEYGTSGGEILAKHLPTALVYKSFNTLGVEHMTNESAKGKQMFLAGDPNENARSITEGIISAVGFKPFYVGPIRYSRNLEAIAELWIHMAIPPLGARTMSRNNWFSLTENP